jgi:hypothetical protein
MASRRRAPRRRRRRGPRVESRLLPLAREVGAIAKALDPPGVRRDRALGAITRTFAGDPGLTAALLDEWRQARSDEHLALALAWAREQVRGALQEILESGVAAGAVRKEPDAAALAWIVLAACEALLREAPDGGVLPTGDLLRALARLTEA